MALSDATLLELTKVDDSDSFSLNEYSARGIQMTMEPVQGSGLVRRDINGNLVNLSAPQNRKYKFHISCSDLESPAFAAASTDETPLWPGDLFELVCIPQLGAVEAQTFDVMLMAPGWQIQTDEWGAAVSWSLDFEEV